MGKKYSLATDKVQLPELFRAIADALEGKEGDFALPAMQEFTKFKIGVKDEYGKMVVKLAVKSDHTDYDEESCQCGGIRPDGMPKYKLLKKRMQRSFKAIFQAIHAEVLPPAEAVEEFVADSRLMTQYSGYGDEYYGAYDEAVNAFEEAWKREDIASMHDLIDALNHLKTDCHNRYK